MIAPRNYFTRRFQTGLFIGDVHAPYQHEDYVSFLAGAKKRFSPEWVGFSGDEKDHQADSFHEPHPDLYSSGDEYDYAAYALKPLIKLFPVADLMISNHGSLPERKVNSIRLSPKYLKDLRDNIRAPKTWTWHEELYLKSGNRTILAIHGNKHTKNLLAYSIKRNISVMQGHWHHKFEVQYWKSKERLNFACTSGCLINHKSKAYDYDKHNPLDPLLGVTFLRNGFPFLIPMHTNHKNRWTGELP